LRRSSEQILDVDTIRNQAASFGKIAVRIDCWNFPTRRKRDNEIAINSGEIVRHHNQAAVGKLPEIGHCFFNIARTAHLGCNRFDAEGRGGLLERPPVKLAVLCHSFRVVHKRSIARVGRNLLEDREHLCRDAGIQISEARCIASGMSDALGEAAAHGIGNDDKDNWNRSRRPGELGDDRRAVADDDRRLHCNQLLGKGLHLPGFASGKTILDLHVAARSPSLLSHFLFKCADSRLGFCVVRKAKQEANFREAF
jgi:hypothetical protein